MATQRRAEGAYLDRRSDCTNQLCKRNAKELRKYNREQLEPRSVEPSGSSPKPDRVNHQDPVHDRADDRVGDLRQELRDGEDFRRVELTVGLSDERT
jgi:hypothetical protein